MARWLADEMRVKSGDREGAKQRYGLMAIALASAPFHEALRAPKLLTPGKRRNLAVETSRAEPAGSLFIVYDPQQKPVGAEDR